MSSAQADLAALAGLADVVGSWDNRDVSHHPHSITSISDSWKVLQEKAKEETSGFLNELLNHQEENDSIVLQKEAILTDESQRTFRFEDSLEFLSVWYLTARKRIAIPGAMPVKVQMVEPCFPRPVDEDFSPLQGKYRSFLAELGEHSSRSAKHNLQMVLFFLKKKADLPSIDFGIYEDIKSCELNIRIQEDTSKLLPEYSALKKRADLDIARYHERYEGQQLQELKQATEQFSQKLSFVHSESDLAQDEKQRKRFVVFKTLVEKLSKFVDAASGYRDGVGFLSAFDNEKIESSSDAFIKTTFKLVSLCFVVINEVNAKCPLPKIGLARMTLDSWSNFVRDLKDNAELVRNRLATAQSEAATRWLQTEVSGYCYDVCQDTLQHDKSARYPEKGFSEVPPRQVHLGGSATGISRRQHLAVDTHPDCQDLIGMRVWYLDAVPTGGFNQFVNSMRPSCGVMIVHVFLRYNIAIPRLRDHPEKMQAQGLTGNNFACGNVQLPSWVQDACVSRLFCQPLLDFLIQDFVLSLDGKDREPVRLVFTGSAFDAVLATTVASELLFRFNSYREDHLIRKRHSHTAADWDILYNHIRSSIFVLSFMLPAVFSGPHLSPHQLSAKRHGSDKDKPTPTPFDAIGINMLNISVSNCPAFKLVEHWLSVDRTDLANSPKQWISFSKYDRIVLETLQKLLSFCKKTPDFKKSIEQAEADVKAWAHAFEPKRALATFVADYKAKSVSAVKVAIRLINHDSVSTCQTVKQKSMKKTVFDKAGDCAAGLFNLPQNEEWWFGCLKSVKEPFQLLSCNHHLPSAAHKVMDDIASWFLPVAAVHAAFQPQGPNLSMCHREAASYGTLNASDIAIPEVAYLTYGPKPKDENTKGSKEESKGNHSSNLCMQSRLSVKLLGNIESRRLLIRWNCDSMDSHALIRNCFAVTLTACFDPGLVTTEEHQQHTPSFVFRVEECSNSDLRVTVSEHDYESLYSLQCETELFIPDSCKAFDVDKVIDSTVIFVTMRMRFFSAQFGYGHGSSSVSEETKSVFHVGLGPELFCFPKRLVSPQPDRGDDMLLLWFWFYLSRCRSTSLLEVVQSTSDVALGMLKQHFVGIATGSADGGSEGIDGSCYSRRFRKALQLNDFYQSHKFYFDSSSMIQSAFDITFCDFSIQKEEQKSYNSRYLHMRLDELIMQYWDFKLLALNAFGNYEDLQNCKFDEGDAVIQNFDEQCDLIAAQFRGSLSSSKFSQACKACHQTRGEKTRRSSCRLHMFDYLNDDEEGLEYVRKQSSYLRRLSFPKSTFKRITEIFREQQGKAGHPSQNFYQSIGDCIGAISDPHSLMVKLVSSPSEGNPNSTLMNQRSYDGIFNAFFYPPIEARYVLAPHDHRPLLPRFPINLYDNETYKLAQQQDYRHFPTADAKEDQCVIPACSLITRQSSKTHHFRYFFRILEEGLQKGWNSHRTEAEFISWAHGMGVLRSFAIRKEFEAFCGFFENAKERRSVMSWLRSDSESADPYLDCLQQIQQIFGDGFDNSNRFKQTRDDYHAHEERIISLICRHEKCGYGSRAEFRKEMMHEQGRKSFQQKVSFLPGVRFLETLAFFWFRDKSFWASWITTFVCFMSHTHQLRDWLMNNKRCLAAFGDQKVGKSRFWSHSLGIETNPSSQSNTVQTQMWMLPCTQFIDFPAFSEENKLGDSYNFDRFVRCDMLARHIVYDFLLVPDICVYIVKTISPNTESVKKLIAHIRDLEMNRYPAFYGTDDDSASGGDLPVSRNRSGGGLQSFRAAGNNRLARESVLLCSHTQNFICRLEPVNLGAFSKLLTFDPKLLSVDKGNLTPEHLLEIGRHPELKKSKFVWVCGGSDGSDDHGHAVPIIEKIQVDGKQAVWKVIADPATGISKQSLSISPRELWQRLRAKLEKKKRTIGEMFSSKNVFLAYFAEYHTEFNSPFDDDVENHIQQDFPWSSAFCESTGNFQNAVTHESVVDAASSLGDLPILNASQSLELVLRKMFTSEQFQPDRLNELIGKILLRPMAILKSPDALVSADSKQQMCNVCADDEIYDEHATQMCEQCNLFMCEAHATLHLRKKKDHHVSKIVDAAAEETRRRAFEVLLVERDREERMHPNSYTNRQVRHKIWHFQQQNIVFRGQSVIDELCEDSGHIQSLLTSLQQLRDVLAFDLSACESSRFGIGVAFWSYLMGDTDGSNGHASSVFCAERMRWRSLGTSLTPTQLTPTSPSASPFRLSRVNSNQRSQEDVIQKFISDVNTLWLEVKCGGASLKTEISKMKAAVSQDPQKMLTLAETGDSIVDASNLSSGEFSDCRVVPWFSALFYRMLQEGNILDLNVSDGLFDRLKDSGSQNVTSQEFCLALIKIILLPLLASKKCANGSVAKLLEYGDDFFLSFFYLEKAMFECRQSRIVGESCPLFAWLSIQSAIQDQSIRCVEAMSLLLRSITVKGLIELSDIDSLDFQPCVAGLACEHMYSILCESRSAFALNHSLVFAGTSQRTTEQSRRSLIEDTQLAFEDKIDRLVLKPVCEIEEKIGQNWGSVSAIASKTDFERVFRISRTVKEHFGAVKRRMHDLVDGSYAAVTVRNYHKISNDLQNPSMSGDSFFDIPLMGRTLMGVAINGVVRCFLTDPCFCYFECKLHCGSFKSANEVGKGMQFLRLSFKTLRNMNIDKLEDSSSFTFILSNCSTVFFEELQVEKLESQAIAPSYVTWSDLSLLEFEPNAHYPRPFHDCSVELEPYSSAEAAHSGHQLEAVPLSGCIVGQCVTMNISFRPTKPITDCVHVFVVLDDAFDYITLKSSTLTISHYRPTSTIWPFQRKAPYEIKRIETGKGKYTLMDVFLDPHDIPYEGRITISFPAKNPPGERLYRNACFIYLRNLLDPTPTHELFFLKSPIPLCLGCGIAQTPEILRMPLQQSEILISKARLGEQHVDLLVTFECSVSFFVYEPSSDLDKVKMKASIVEIVLPESWDNIAKDDQPVSFLCEAANGEHTDLPVELQEFSNTKISVRIKPEYRGRSKIFLHEGSKCSIVVRGIALPAQSDEIRSAIDLVKEANIKLKEAIAETTQGAESQAVYESCKKEADKATSNLVSLKEKLTSGCMVTIKDATQSIVMTGRNVPMSPFFDDEQYATVIQRRSFEESEYKKAHDAPMEWSSQHEGHFWTKLEEFINAFLKQHCGSIELFQSDKYQNAKNVYMGAIGRALHSHQMKKLTDTILKQMYQKHQGQGDDQAVQDYNVVSRVAAMAIQLWSSDIALELGPLDNQRFGFFQMLNRFALSTDSKELFECGGMTLIKAIKRNIVTARPPAVVPLTADQCVVVDSRPQTQSVQSLEGKIYGFFRGGSVPFEMAGFFSLGKVFRFPVFLATSRNHKVARDFALKVNAEERTLWKISAPRDCLHFKALQDNALLPHEEEFLFPPYSAFRVTSNRREAIPHSSSMKTLHLRIICLEALADNQAHEAQNVPTAPRY